MSAGLRAIAIAIVLVALPAQNASADPSSAAEWRNAATQDLDAIRSIIVTDTPVGAGAAGPSYDAWLAQGYAQAQARLSQVQDRISYFYTLAAFVNGFHDPHLSLSPNQALPAPRWPGFVASRQRDEIVVSWRDAGDASAPPLGARVVSCDGQSPDALIERDVYAFTIDPRLPESKRRATPRLFLDVGNPFAPAPQACVFNINGAERTITLAWRPLPNPPAPFNTAFSDAGLGPSALFGLTHPADGSAWIGAPTFLSDTQSGIPLGAMMNDVVTHAAEIRAGRAIVIDIRGNRGGSTDWGQRLAQSIFGASYIAQRPLPNPSGAALWRASVGNLQYWQNFHHELILQANPNLRANAQANDVSSGLARAVARHEPVWREGSNTQSPASGGLTQRRPHGASPIPAHVFVLSNGSCVSACLDFLDVVLQIPGVTLLGAPSSADTLLADVRSSPLPSGQARFSFAQKMMIGRGRAAMEFYAPDIAYDGPWTDEAVRAWVMGIVTSQTTASAAH